MRIPNQVRITLVLAALLAAPGGAFAHGLMVDPPARNAFCGYITKPDQVNNGTAQYPVCGDAFKATGVDPNAGYSFMAVLTHTTGYAGVGARTNVCSFNSETWSGNPTPWDQPIAWPTTAISSGPLTITWNISWGPHFSDTQEFRYWITKPDFVYTVGKALSFSDFEAQPFCYLPYDDTNPTGNPNVIPDTAAATFKTKCTVPARSGRHVIYGEWGRNQWTYERFHGCIDVTFGGGTTSYNLTVTKGGTGAGTVTASSGGINCGSTCSASYPSGANVTLTAAAATGSTFAGWSGACSGAAATCAVSMTAARAVTATFNTSGGTSYALTVTKSGTGTGTVYSTPAGITCGTTCSASFASGTVVTLIADVPSGSTFAGWGGACTGTGPCTVTMSQATSVSATINTSGGTTFALTVTKAGTGSGTVTSTPAGVACGTTCSASFNSGTSVTLSAAAASGSTFAGWSGACTGTGSCITTMTAARAVTATFNASGGTTFALNVTRSGTGSGTVTSSAGGINCGTACSATLASGTTVTLTATAASGSTFAGWSNGCTGTATTCTVSMTAARTVDAAFNTSGGGTTPCANPVTFTNNTNNFNTTGAVCYRTAQRVNGWGCSNFAGRTVSVNGGTATATCGAGPFPLTQVGGYTYFSATAGQYPWAGIYVW